MHLIESYEPERTVLLDGRTLPAQALVEDDDGIRWFLSDEAYEHVDARRWTKAAAAGAAAVLCPRAGRWLAVTTEWFMGHRTDQGLGFRPDPGQWQVYQQVPTYLQVMTGSPEPVEEQPAEAFVHIHSHFDFSLLDGMTTVDEGARIVAEQGGTALGMADHGTCAGHPEHQAACDRHGIKPIFAMETYLVEDRFRRLEHFTLPDGMDEKSEQAVALRKAYVKDLRDYMHLVLIAVDDEGLRNLWAISTEGYRDGFYAKNPRIDWDTLRRFSSGIIATSACLRGPLTHHALLEGNQALAVERLGRFIDIFGDRFYIEIHTNQLAEQIKVNHDLVALAQAVDLPMIAAVDAHYPTPADKHTHQVMVSMNTDKEIGDDSDLFAGNQDYHLKTEAEVRENLSYLPPDVVESCIKNTALIAQACTARITGKSVTPVYSTHGGHDADAERLLDLCLANWAKITGKREPQHVYEARFEREYRLLVAKEYCGYYLMWSDICLWAKSQRILVGPGRGSGGGSLVAYLAGINDIDPVDADLLFERFMTEGRVSLPDFDVDFPQSRKGEIQSYVERRWGKDAAAVVGSVVRFKSKGIVAKLSSTLKSQLPDDWFLSQKQISAIIDAAEGDTAGLGLSWEALWDKAGEYLQPYRDAQPYLFEQADRLVGRVHTFGQHAAGMIISTDEDLITRLPLRVASEEAERLIVQFDKDVLEALGLVKFDFLTLRNLDTIQDTIDLIRTSRGHEIDVYAWREEYLDPQVWEEIAEAKTLGIFQIETTLGTRYAARMRPRNLADLADLITIVRPGPRGSGLTETYLARRDGHAQVTYPDQRMAAFLGKTFGCLLYQEDIMQACMVLAGYDSGEADEVRKILGKKKVEKVAVAGQEFVSRAVERGMDPSGAALLWSQMAEFAKYSFGRAHAYAYAVLGYWCAWLKFHYPVEYLTCALSTVDKDRIPDFVKESRRMGFEVLPPDINESGVGFTNGTLRVRYGLGSIKGIGEAAKTIVAGQPYVSYEDFIARAVEPKDTNVNMGHVAALARVGAFDALVPNRRGLEQMLHNDKSGTSTRCVHKTDQPDTFTWVTLATPSKESETIALPCSFDWDSEPVPVNPRTNKKTKRKAPVRKCTKACRNYLAPPPLVIEDVPPYTEADIREIEQDLLGVYLSSTPFDVLPPNEREVCHQYAELMLRPIGPSGLYLTAGVLTKVRPHEDRTGNKMGFLAFETEVGNVDVTCFSKAWTLYRASLKVGQFYVFEASRDSRGFSLATVMTYQPALQET